MPVPKDKLRLGGMALRNGLLVHGPTHWAAAIKTTDGQVKVASGPKPRLGTGPVERVPGLRGVAKLAEAMAVIPLVKRALPDAKLPMQDPRTLAAMGAVSLTAHAIRRPGAARTAGREAAVALLSVTPALLALRQGELASWHGVERRALRLTDSLSVVGALAIDRALDREEGVDTAHDLDRNRREGDLLLASSLTSCVFLKIRHGEERAPVGPLTVGAAGPDVLIVQVHELWLVLFAASVAQTSNVWLPGARL